MKTILFVGYRDKARLIQSTQEKGYKIKLLINEKEYRKEYEEIFEKVIVVGNIFDWNSVESALKYDKFDGVLTRYEDYTALVAAIADTFNLPSSGYENALKSRNKYLMRQTFAEQKIPSADFALVQKVEDGKELIEKYGFPLILKQIAGIHSRYVFKIRSEDELKERLDFLHKALAEDTSLLSENLVNYPRERRVPDPKKYFLLEELMTGDELTVDALILNGEIFLTPICKYVTSEEIGFEDHHLPIRIMPYELPKEDADLIYEIVRKALGALKLNYCATHTEVFFNAQTKECRLIEIASRAGGFRSEMFEASQGGDLDLAISEVSVAEKPNLKQTYSKFAAVVEVFSPNDGVLENIEYEFLYEDEAVSNLTINQDIGNQVGLAQNGGKYIVKFMITQDNYAESLEKAKTYLKKIHDSIEVV